MKLNQSALGLAFVLIMPFLLCSCATTDLVTGRPTKNLYDIADDIELGREGMKDFLREMKEDGARVVSEPSQRGWIEAIVRHTAKANGLTTFPYQVTVFETEEANAMALPGGSIVALTGLWNAEDPMVRDRDEMAAVIAHEMAHVECRHSTESMTRELPMVLLLGGVGLYAELEEDEDLANIATAAFVLYEGLAIPKYSRADELEADRIGLMYMARAGYDPQAALRIWKRLDETEDDDWGPLNILSTHPPHNQRYKALEPLLPGAMLEYRQARETHGAPPGNMPKQSGGKKRKE